MALAVPPLSLATSPRSLSTQLSLAVASDRSRRVKNRARGTGSTAALVAKIAFREATKILAAAREECR